MRTNHAVPAFDKTLAEPVPPKLVEESNTTPSPLSHSSLAIRDICVIRGCPFAPEFSCGLYYESADMPCLPFSAPPRIRHRQECL